MILQQRARLLALFQVKKGQWIDSAEIGDVGGLQYGARIFELRRLGYAIESRVQRVAGTAGLALD
jgi:hypothetical protein